MKKHNQKWNCINYCGSCCKLAPEERIEAIAALTEEDRQEYFNLVASDGWCKNYDKHLRKCKIYDRRPNFCKVDNLTEIFGYKKKDKDNIAINFCRQNIRSVHGGRSKVLKRFNRSLGI